MMKEKIEQIIDRNTEGNYLLSSADKAQMVSEIMDLVGVADSFISKLPSVRLSMEEILKDAVRRQVTYQVQFADYDLHTWTAPCQLTENRMEKLLNDGSIRKVRLELEM